MQKDLVNIGKGITGLRWHLINLIQLVHNLTDNRNVFHVIARATKNVTHKKNKEVQTLFISETLRFCNPGKSSLSTKSFNE